MKDSILVAFIKAFYKAIFWVLCYLNYIVLKNKSWQALIRSAGWLVSFKFGIIDWVITAGDINWRKFTKSKHNWYLSCQTKYKNLWLVYWLLFFNHTWPPQELNHPRQDYTSLGQEQAWPTPEHNHPPPECHYLTQECGILTPECHFLTQEHSQSQLTHCKSPKTYPNQPHTNAILAPTSFYLTPAYSIHSLTHCLLYPTHFKK